MSNQSVLAENVALSRDFFMDPNSYSAIDLTKDGRNIIWCIEPRDPADVMPGEHKTVIQTPGAGVGEGLDTALALTVIKYKLRKAETIEQGMVDNLAVRVTTVADAHFDCKFNRGLLGVTQEMASPSDFTRESALRWSRFLGYEDTVKRLMPTVMDAAGLQHQYVSEQSNMDHLIHYLDRLYPAHRNVKHVIGENWARVYVTNLHRLVSQDRNKKPRDPEEAYKIQGYHDSVAAAFQDSAMIPGLSASERGLRLTSLLMRSAATRTVLTADHMDEMTFLTVHPTHNGIEIKEEM